jgi:hypothetical protein
VVLWGLGRNARAVARELARRGIGFVGVDDGFEGEPAWAKEDGVRVERMAAGAAMGMDGVHVVTPLNDGALVARLEGRGRGARVVRWRGMAGALASSAMREAMAAMRAKAPEGCAA